MARTQTVTILFCDLVASTERRARLGDDAFDAFTARFMAALRAAVDGHGGRVVSTAGDGLMAVFPDSAADGVAAASSMHAAVARLDDADPPRLRVGISAGEVAEADGEYSGMPIVEAARLEAAAEPGRTYASAVVRAIVGNRRGLRFRDVGALQLKGIPEPLPTVEVVDATTPAATASRPDATRRPAPVAATGSGRRRTLAIAGGVLVVVAIGVAIALLRAGAGSDDAAGIPAPDGYTPRLSAATCPPDVTSAAPEATCRRLVVPQDRDKPGGRTVSLLVTSAPGRGGQTSGPPTLDLCGCEDLGNSVVREHGPLVQLSARGFGASEPQLQCPAMNTVVTTSLARAADDETSIAEGRDALAACHRKLVGDGVDPSQYNFATAAHDALDLMVAAHYDRVDLTATDLASAEAFEVLRTAPGAVRSITIDNPAPPGRSVLTNPPHDLSSAFDRYVAVCTSDARCHAAYPDLPGAWRAAFDRYQARPVLITTKSPSDDSVPATTVLVDGPRAAEALATALTTPDAYPVIPTAITGAQGEDATAGQYLAGDYYASHSDAPWGTLASYFCAYDVHTIDAASTKLVTDATPQFTRPLATPWPTWCQAWKVDDVTDRLDRAVVSSVPVFLFRGDLSPTGDPAWIGQVRRGLSNAQVVVFPTLGDNLLTGGPACLTRLRIAFLDHPGRALPTRACAKESPAIDWVTP